MALADIVNVNITTESSKVTQKGFGTPIILSAHQLNNDRARRYANASDLVDDGFLATGPEYAAASAVFAQNPRPKEVVIGRLANRPTQVYTLTPAVANARKYQLRVDDNLVEVTSDADATAAEITTALNTAITALAISGLTVGAGGGSTLTLTSAIGTFHAVESLDPAKLGIAQTHADPGVAADLDAIKDENDDWYAIINPFNSRAMILAIAGWAETNEKLFIAASNESAIVTGGFDASGVADVASELRRLQRFRTAVIYHPDPGDFADATWVGAGSPLDPGSETWKFMTLSGAATTVLTSTQRSNALAKNANVYLMVAGVGMAEPGTVAAGEFIDVIRFRDWLKARLQEGVFSLFVNAPTKIPYTDAGANGVGDVIRGVLLEGVAVGGLKADPEPIVNVPKVADVSSVSRGARMLPNVKWSAELAGAIHAVDIGGQISV